MEFVTTATETEALLLEANLIKQLKPRFNVLLRDDKSFPYILITGDHGAPQITKHRGARNRQGRYFGPFASAGRSTARSPRCSAPSCCAPARTASSRAARGPACSTRSSAARRPARGEIDCPDYAELVREATRLPVRPQPGGEGAARGRDGEGVRRARIRARGASIATASRALSAIQAQQGINPRTRRRGRRLRRPPGGRPVLRRGVLLPHRPELGQPRLFPARRPKRSTPERGAGGLPGAVLRRQAGAAAGPAVARDRGARAAGARRCRVKAGRKVEIVVPQRGEKRDLVEHALDQRARGARPQARRDRRRSRSCSTALARALRPAAARRGGSRSTTTATSWARTRSAR